jgi:guanylate kinase
MKKKKIIIIGKAASGKDFLQKQLVLNGWIPLRQYTTRPIRPAEDGSEYHLVSEEEFDSISNNLMSVQSFNGWKYGFDINEALNSDVMIFSPANFFSINISVDSKIEEFLNNSTVVYLDIDEETRRERLSKRYVGGKEDDSLERRLQADKKDFKYIEDIVDWNNFPDLYVRLYNEVEVDEFLKNLLS